MSQHEANQHSHSEHTACECGHHHEHEGHHHHEGCACGHHHHAEDCGCGHHHHHHHPEGCGCGHDHGQEEQGVSVQFSGVFNLPAEEVWQLITDNEQLQQWYPELVFEGMETGATLRFNYQSGGSEEMMVLDVERPHYLSFTWDLNIITFELNEFEEGKTALVFTEWLSELNDHSPKDLTGWMIALQNMAEVAEGKPVSDREAQFHEYYPKIKEMLTQQTDVVFED